MTEAEKQEILHLLEAHERTVLKSVDHATFFDALDKGKEMPLTSLTEAARTHEIIFAADRSAETGKSVKL